MFSKNRNVDMFLFIAADPYCFIKYEGTSVQTNYKEKTLNPEWDERVTLYRKKLPEDVVIEVSIFRMYTCIWYK